MFTTDVFALSILYSIRESKFNATLASYGRPVLLLLTINDHRQQPCSYARVLFLRLVLSSTV
jgi:hypothetical protein